MTSETGSDRLNVWFLDVLLSAGIGRTGTIVVIDMLIDIIDTKGELTVSLFLEPYQFFEVAQIKGHVFKSSPEERQNMSSLEL